jgi:hypothetical protein
MAPSNRASLVIRGSVICAALGSLIGGCASLLISAVRGNFVLESLSLIPIAILFAAVTAAPFGFAVGAIGVLWLTFRAQRTSGRRLYLEAAGMGAALGATFPLLRSILGWALSKIFWQRGRFQSEPG